MSEKYHKISTVAEVQSGFAYPSDSYQDSGVPIVRMSDLKKGYLKFENTKYVSGNWLVTTSAFALNNLDFLLGMSGSLENHAVVKIENLPALLNQRVARLKLKSQSASYKYLTYWLSSEYYYRYADIQGEGAAQKNISARQIESFEIRLPGISEQQKIAAILTSIDTAIEKTEALIEKYQHIKAGLMHDLFTRGVLPNGQLRPPRTKAPELYQETAIGWIPTEWDVVRMVELAENRKGSTTIGPFGSDLVATDYRLEGVPIVFVRDVKESGFEWNSETYVSERKAIQLAAHIVKAGEVLATKMGLPPCISCLYPDWMPNGVITADMIRLVPDSDKVDGYWLTIAINHDRVKRQVAAITAGVTRLKVTLADFRGIRIAKPELNEQMLISKRIRAAQNIIDVELDRVTKLEIQKLGLMQDLLTGKSRVKINDSVLSSEPVDA